MADQQGERTNTPDTDRNTKERDNKRVTRSWSSLTGESPPTHRLKSDLSLPVEHFIDLLCDERVVTVLQGIFEKAVKSMIDPIKNQVTELEKKVADRDESLSKQAEKISALESDMKDIKKSLDTTKDEIKNLKIAHDDLEQYGRRVNLRFSGIKPSGNANTPEDTDKAVLHLCRDKLGVQVQLSDIQRSHRLGPVDSTNRGIIARFVSYRARSQILKARSKLKGTSIFVNEDLTKHRNKLAYLGRQLKKESKIVDTWTFDGKVLVKFRLAINNPTLKTIEIKDESDLHRFY